MFAAEERKTFYTRSDCFGGEKIYYYLLCSNVPFEA